MCFYVSILCLDLIYEKNSAVYNNSSFETPGLVPLSLSEQNEVPKVGGVPRLAGAELGIDPTSVDPAWLLPPCHSQVHPSAPHSECPVLRLQATCLRGSPEMMSLWPGVRFSSLHSCQQTSHSLLSCLQNEEEGTERPRAKPWVPLPPPSKGTLRPQPSTVPERGQAGITSAPGTARLSGVRPVFKECTWFPLHKQVYLLEGGGCRSC